LDTFAILELGGKLCSARLKMNLNHSWQIRLAQILVGAALVILLVNVGGTNAQNGPVHSTSDWSHHHLIFSTPNTLAGRIQLSSNPRYVQQWVRRNAERKLAANASPSHTAQTTPLQGDWSMNMGTNARVGPGVYPAKFSFDITTANCATATQPDFVVFNMSLAGNNTSVTASATGQFSGQTGVITITNPSLSHTLVMSPALANANTGSGTGTYIRGSNGTEASNFITAINIAGNGDFVGVTGFSSGGANSILHATSTGTGGNSIQVSSSGSFTWLTGPTFTGGANGQADIMAFDNLYSGCTGTKPTPYWAYNTGGAVVTSPVISLDGKQVAFIQTQGGFANLVVLTWKASATDNFNNPTSPTSVAAGSYQGCTAPCMTVIPFSFTGNPRTDTNSSPFYDFAQDTIYVGDNGGRLRKFTHVFNGAPAETTTSGWPVLLTANNVNSSPVYDHTTNKVFVGDTGGFLYSVTVPTPPAVPVVVKSARVGFTFGILDGPVIDSSAGTVYVYVANNSAAAPPTGNSAVFQFKTNFAANTSGTTVTIGDSSGSARGFAGDFDNAYFSSPSGNAGHLYVCGSVAGGVSYMPTLWQIPITGTGAMGVPVQGPQLATVNNIPCSPVVEVFNSGTSKDLIFLSVTNRANTAAPIACPSNLAGCLMSFDVTSGAAISPAGTTTTATLRVAGGASGVIIDNTSSFAGASQVYFTPLTNQACATSGGFGGCAIQASQAGLN
jgi:hypothetical protein